MKFYRLSHWFIILIIILVSWTFTSVKAEPESSDSKTVPKIEMKQICGALLRDDFNGDQIDRNLWHRLKFNPAGIRVEVDQGELCIRGVSRRMDTDQPGTDSRHMSRGVFSRYFAQTDVSLAVKVKIPSGIAVEPGSHVANVHLCGVNPDAYPEVLFGKLESGQTKSIFAEYSNLGNRPWPDARGWWFSVVQGTSTWEKVGEEIPELGDERERFHDVLVEYDESTQLATAFLNVNDQWIQLGHERFVSRGATTVELKMVNITDRYGFHRDIRFDDCRLYLNPRRNPVRLITNAYDIKKGHLPYDGPKLRAELYNRSGEHLISKGFMDKSGFVYLPVDHPEWIAFPVSAMVRLFQENKELARGTIDADGINGLYPGDAWIIDVNQIKIEN